MALLMQNVIRNTVSLQLYSAVTGSSLHQSSSFSIPSQCSIETLEKLLMNHARNLADDRKGEGKIKLAPLDTLETSQFKLEDVLAATCLEIAVIYDPPPASKSSCGGERSSTPTFGSSDSDRGKSAPASISLSPPARGLGGRNQLRFMEVSQNQQTDEELKRALNVKISWSEVKQHQSEDDCWVVFDGIVYDITPYLNYHPGGKKILLNAAGDDCTALFRRYHPWVNGHAILKSCFKGKIVGKRCERIMEEVA